MHRSPGYRACIGRSLCSFNPENLAAIAIHGFWPDFYSPPGTGSIASWRIMYCCQSLRTLDIITSVFTSLKRVNLHSQCCLCSLHIFVVVCCLHRHCVCANAIHYRFVVAQYLKERGLTMAKYVIALDQGTTSSRAILFNHDGTIVSVAQQEFPQIYPAPGLVEHDPEAIWSSQLNVAHEVMKKVGASAQDIAALGITNQRETGIVWGT